LLLVREEAWNFEREGNNYGVFKLLKVYSHLLFINKLWTVAYVQRTNAPFRSKTLD
jgi:hypothetical protein